MKEDETIIFGIPVPSDNKVFLAFIVVHIILGLICTISGVTAMLSRKAHGLHSKAGKIYYWSMTALFITVVITSVMRWPHNVHLLIVGTLAYTLTVIGKRFARPVMQKRSRIHTVCMGFSFVLLMTGFYVDNGKNLPFWNQFSQLFFWLFPSAIGIPIILYVFFNHPLNKRP
jgi:hypothetical protein